MREEKGLTFPLLVDPDLEIVRRYGLLNEEAGDLPHPAAVIVDPRGTVRFLRIDEDYRRRPSAEELLAALPAPNSKNSK